MIPRSRLAILLLIVAIITLACQLLVPAKESCRVNAPTTGWKAFSDGDEISFTVDNIEWTATVDCGIGHLVDGQPARPSGGRQLAVTVAGTSYKLTTTDQSLSMSEYRENGSHIRIDMSDRYYVAVLAAEPGNFGQAMIRYFMGGEASGHLQKIYCYNQTKGEQHTSLPAVGGMWNESKPVVVNLICSARDFVLEISTEISPQMLQQGPTLPPVTPVPTITPEPPGWHSMELRAS